MCKRRAQRLRVIRADMWRCGLSSGILRSARWPENWKSCGQKTANLKQRAGSSSNGAGGAWHRQEGKRKWVGSGSRWTLQRYFDRPAGPKIEKVVAKRRPTSKGVSRSFKGTSGQVFEMALGGKRGGTHERIIWAFHVHQQGQINPRAVRLPQPR